MAHATDGLICPSSALLERGRAVCFTLPNGQQPLAAMIVRYQGRVYGYLNRCQHLPVNLDEQAGEVFDLTGHFLLCSRHGARYRPNDGVCVSGPCQGQRLTPVNTTERDGMIYYVIPITLPIQPMHPE